MTIAIDTTQAARIQVSLNEHGKGNTATEENQFGSQVVVPLLAKLVADPSGITEVTVATGPGSYTGTRVGVSVANAVAYVCKVPINGMAVGTYAVPIYQGENE